MWRLYVIVDTSAAHGRDLAWIAEQAIRGGADVLQVRDKTASTRDFIKESQEVLRIAQAAKIPLLINDRIDVAVAVGADGIHLGQEDLPIAVARQMLGPTRIIGKSTHTLEQALEANRDGADYIAVGPMFPTPTKPDYPPVGLSLLAQVKAHVQKPVVAIGGIDPSTLPEVLKSGAECVAVVRAVCGTENPEAAARHLKRLMIQYVRADALPSL